MENEKTQNTAAEMSLRDVVGFAKRNGKLVLLWVLATLILAGVYLAITPNKFEARWQLRMAQFVTNREDGGSGRNNAVTNVSRIEDPDGLAQRLRFPTAYPVEVRRACGVPESVEDKEYWGGALMVSAIRNVSGVVEMKVHAASPSQAAQCAQALVNMVTEQQHDMVEVQLAGYRARILKYQQTLAQMEQQLGAKTNKDSALYLLNSMSNIQGMSQLRLRIDDLEGDIVQSQLNPTLVTAPIYVDSKPVAPKPGLVLPLGAALGLILGVLHALTREGWRRAYPSP